ncbi:hypothetical protein D4764_10G0007890, partial [Takifugu flavidus]
GFYATSRVFSPRKPPQKSPSVAALLFPILTVRLPPSRLLLPHPAPRGEWTPPPSPAHVGRGQSPKRCAGSSISQQPCWQVIPPDLRESPCKDEEKNPTQQEPARKDPPISTQYQTDHERSVSSGSRTAGTRPTANARGAAAAAGSGHQVAPVEGRSPPEVSRRSWIHPSEPASVSPTVNVCGNTPA